MFTEDGSLYSIICGLLGRAQLGFVLAIVWVHRYMCHASAFLCNCSLFFLKIKQANE